MHCQERNGIENVRTWVQFLFKVVANHFVSFSQKLIHSLSQWSGDDDLKVLRIKFFIKILWMRLKNWIYFAVQNGLEWSLAGLSSAVGFGKEEKKNMPISRFMFNIHNNSSLIKSEQVSTQHKHHFRMHAMFLFRMTFLPSSSWLFGS